MAVHTIRCPKCDETRDMLYRIADPEGPAARAAGARCHVCGHQGMQIDFSQCKVGDPVISFREGFFNIGTSRNGKKYYSTLRQMRNDAARKGINLVKG